MMAKRDGWLTGQGPRAASDGALVQLLGGPRDSLEPLKRVCVGAGGGAAHKQREIDEDRRCGERIGLCLFEQALVAFWVAAHSPSLKSYMQEHGLSLRDMEQRVGVSRSSLSNLINGKESEPRLTTLVEIARTIGLPLWRVIEMAGVDLGLPETPSYNAERLASIAGQQEEFHQLIVLLLAAEPGQIKSVLNYLEFPDSGQPSELRVTILSDRQREMVARLLKLQPALLPELPPRQNVYEGASLANAQGGPLWAVTVNGVALGAALGWQRDFAWGYLGAGPMALAEGILSYEYGEALRERYRQQLYSDVTSTLPQGRERNGRLWSLESQELDLWLVLTRLSEQAEKVGLPVSSPAPEYFLAVASAPLRGRLGVVSVSSGRRLPWPVTGTKSAPQCSRRGMHRTLIYRPCRGSPTNTPWASDISYIAICTLACSSGR
jgi:transcriptional regulator with XRE-family HTH domain